MTLCKLVREQTHAEALSCLSPIETSRGFLVLSLISFRGFELPMKFMRKKEDLYLYFHDNKYELYKGRGIEPVWDDECPPTIYHLVGFSSRETQALLIHSAFCRMMRHDRAADAAYADAADAAFAAYAYADAADAAAVYNNEFRKAFRLMIKWRKIK